MDWLPIHELVIHGYLLVILSNYYFNNENFKRSLMYLSTHVPQHTCTLAHMYLSTHVPQLSFIHLISSKQVENKGPELTPDLPTLVTLAALTAESLCFLRRCDDSRNRFLWCARKNAKFTSEFYYKSKYCGNCTK
jgi:hypothetical protein